MNYYQKEKKENTPQFNSGIAYLERINRLYQLYHEYTIMNNNQSAYECLEQIRGELTPRLNEEERAELREVSLKTGNIVYAQGLGNARRTKAILRDYFIACNILAHKKKLIMQDLPDELVAVGKV